MKYLIEYVNREVSSKLYKLYTIYIMFSFILYLEMHAYTPGYNTWVEKASSHCNRLFQRGNPVSG